MPGMKVLAERGPSGSSQGDPLSSWWWLPSVAGSLWLVAAYLQPLDPSSCGVLPCAPLCPNVFFL